MDQSDLKAQILYFLREKYYNLMLKASKDGISMYKGEHSFHLFHALSLILNDRIEEGLHVLESVRSENDIKLAVVIAIMYANKLLGVSNKEIYMKLDAQMRELRKTAEAVEFYYSGFVLYALGKLGKALDYLEKSSTLNSDLEECLTLKGWVLLELKKNGQQSVASISEIFNQAIARNGRNLDALFGLAESYLYENKYEEALSITNKTIVRFPAIDIPLVLKMKIQLALLNWDQVNETLNRILLINADNLDALKASIITSLCRDTNYNESVLCIKKYRSVLDQIEPKNGKLSIQSAQLFSKISGKNIKVLNETYNMVEKVVKSNSDNAEFIIELGNQCFLQNKLKEASRYFKTATKINSSSANALIGLTLLEIRSNGPSSQAKQQLDYLSDLQESQNSALCLFIRAKLADDKDEAIDCLNKIRDLHLEPIKTYPYSDEFLQLLNPVFLLEVVKEYLKYIPFTKSLSLKQKANSPSDFVFIVVDILSLLTRSCPGLHEPLYLLAKLQFYLTGDANSAISNLDKILLSDNASSEAYILMAQIQVYNGMYDRAAQNLEAGLSSDFKVREDPTFHFISGTVQKKMNNYQDAIKSFTTALTLINERTKHENVGGDVDLSDKAAIFIELIESHNEVGQVDEALKVLDEATEVLQKTPEEAQIIILCAEQAIYHRNIQGALDLLAKVKSTDSYYAQARAKYANMLLEYRKDKHAYLKCYLDMVDDNPGAESYNLLGDAYMVILEPDDAIEAYTKALQENPKNPYINLKLGETLEFAHYFKKAISFYKDAIELTNDMKLKLQLANLYMQMKDYVRAENLLITEIEQERNDLVEDVTYLQDKTKLLNLLTAIQEKSGNFAGALSTLKDAKDNQNRVRKRLTIELIRVPQDEIDSFVDICVKLAEMSVSMKDKERAIQYYKEALEISPQDVSVMSALAKLYMQMNSLELCQRTCTSILQIDQENEIASVIMADIAFHKIDFDMALFHFTQLITKQHTNWNAMVRLVEIMRRTGNLDEAPKYLDIAEKACSNPLKDAGYLYCKALYQWYSGNLNGALRNFNLARQDLDWGQQAIYNMIEICVNPEDDMFTDQFIETEDLEYRDSRSMALKTADRLLKELKQRLDANGDEILKYKLLNNFRLLSTKEKQNIDQAMEGFVTLASQNAYKDHIGVILGMSTAYTLLKQSQRAKNQLKRVVKTPWTFEDAEYLERCWLLLSDYYVQSGKFDVALDLLNKVVYHNKTSSKAYEYLGTICEKEQKYKEAVVNYELAWKCGGKVNASVGHKLAHSFLKCKKYPDAYDMGQQVLKINPEFPRVKKDILDKAMSNLRI